MEFKLIIKKLNNTLSDEENIIFSKWYMESNFHKNYFNSVKKNYDITIDDVDVERGWHTLQNKLKARKQKKHYWKYAVAATIVVLITATYFYHKETIVIIEEPVVVDTENTIETGTDKATLTLDDGSVIPLEKGKTYTGNNINSNGEELIYNKEKDSKPETVFNILTIPRGGQFYLKLSDGTQVWLNSDSKLRYPVNFKEDEAREVELLYGEVYFEVTPSSENKGSKFKVKNVNQVVEVLGTEFNIKAYKEEDIIYTTLVEGKVSLSNGVRKENLLPSQQSKLDIKSKDISVKKVDVSSEIAWKKGLFSFKSKTLKEIMIVLSRWYDVEVIFENKELENVKFNGVLSKHDTIEEIFTSIKNTNFINAYDIKDKQITIK